MSRLRPYRAGDAWLVSLRSEQAGDRMSFYDTAEGPAMTFERQGVVIACAGLARVWEGRYLAWALFSDLAPREWVRVRQAMHRVIGDTAGRIEATAAFPAAERFLEGLGFEKEGVMRSYHNGRDHALYAQVKS